jgi:hypothetical protein
MREKSRRMWKNPETRERLTEWRRNNNKKYRVAMNELNKRQWQDGEYRKRVKEHSRKQMIARWQDPAFREKMGALSTELNKKRWSNPVFKDRVSRSIRVAMLDPIRKKRKQEVNAEIARRPENRARSSEALKQRWRDPEYRKRKSAELSEQAKKKWRDPEYRRKQIEVLKRYARSPENIARIRQLAVENHGKPWTPERRAAQAERNRKRWSDSKYKETVSRNISKAKRGKRPQCRDVSQITGTTMKTA